MFDLNKGRVLVVEDNSVNQKVAASMLKSEGYRADIVANGREALEALARIPYTLVFMDCRMPEMDGYTATREIRRREAMDQRLLARNEEVSGSVCSDPVTRHVPIIAVTANALQGDREKCLEAGMDDYIPKPIRREALQAVLARWQPNRASCLGEQPGTLLEESGDGSPAVDPGVLTELRQLDETGELLATLISQFLDETPQRMAVMQRAVQEGQATILAETAHALKGSSGSLGGTRMHQCCGELETLSRNNELMPVGDRLAQLEAEFVRVQAALLRESERVRSPRGVIAS